MGHSALRIKTLYHYAECCSVENRTLFIVVLDVIMLSVIRPIVVMVSVVSPFIVTSDYEIQ